MQPAVRVIGTAEAVAALAGANDAVIHDNSDSYPRGARLAGSHATFPSTWVQVKICAASSYAA
jgi:hypothetical protein